MVKNKTYKQYGKQAILIEWDAKIDEGILKDILNFKHKITQEKETAFTDLIVGYNSLTIKYIDELNDFLSEVKKLKILYKSSLEVAKENNYLWEIPVCYDLEFGIDLEEISKQSKLSVDEIIQLHSGKEYTIFFIGFVPGFLYLGGLNAQLFFDRKSNPRLQVDKGSVGIGGKQTGVYPTNSAGGWNILGKTPIHFFDGESEKPCFAKGGDKIKFTAVSLEGFYQLEKAIEDQTYIISKTLLND